MEYKLKYLLLNKSISHMEGVQISFRTLNYEHTIFRGYFSTNIIVLFLYHSIIYPFMENSLACQT